MNSALLSRLFRFYTYVGGCRGILQSAALTLLSLGMLFTNNSAVKQQYGKRGAGRIAGASAGVQAKILDDVRFRRTSRSPRREELACRPLHLPRPAVGNMCTLMLIYRYPWISRKWHPTCCSVRSGNLCRLANMFFKNQYT